MHPINTHIIFAILSSFIGVLAFIPYIKNVWTKKTRPHMFTWLIWAITQGTATAILWFGDGGLGIIPMGISVFLVTIVFILSFRNGTKDITNSDTIILLSAFLAILIWWQLENPLLAVLIVSTIDFIGYIPSFRKSYMQPWTETMGSWAAFAIADGLAILALENINILTSSYLITITSANAALVIFLLIRRKQIRKLKPIETHQTRALQES